MPATTLPPSLQTFDQDALMLASLAFREANRTIAGVHSIVAALLYYALLGAAITNDLIGVIIPDAITEA